MRPTLVISPNLTYRTDPSHTKETEMNTYIFIREEGFYPVTLKNDQEAVANALVNPGTVRVENAETNQVVWPTEQGHEFLA